MPSGREMKKKIKTKINDQRNEPLIIWFVSFDSPYTRMVHGPTLYSKCKLNEA